MAALRRAGVETHGTYQAEVTPDASPFDFWQDDITPLLTKTGADTVIFAAAVETDAKAAQLAERAERFFGACAGRRVVYLSSDAVFDGLRGNYTEDDPPSPATLYGKNLVAVEKIVRERCPDACVVRPSYLYGFQAAGSTGGSRPPAAGCCPAKPSLRRRSVQGPYGGCTRRRRRHKACTLRLATLARSISAGCARAFTGFTATL